MRNPSTKNAYVKLKNERTVPGRCFLSAFLRLCIPKWKERSTISPFVRGAAMGTGAGLSRFEEGAIMNFTVGLGTETALLCEEW